MKPLYAARIEDLGPGDFVKVECAACGCVQIAAIPADLSRFYPDDYFSFRSHQDLDRNLVRPSFARSSPTHGWRSLPTTSLGSSCRADRVERSPAMPAG